MYKRTREREWEKKWRQITLKGRVVLYIFFSSFYYIKREPLAFENSYYYCTCFDRRDAFISASIGDAEARLLRSNSRKRNRKSSFAVFSFRILFENFNVFLTWNWSVCKWSQRIRQRRKDSFNFNTILFLFLLLFMMLKHLNELCYFSFITRNKTIFITT